MHLSTTSAILILFFLLTCSGCAGQDRYQTVELDIDGITRAYHIYLPAGYDQDQSLPLVFALHGGGGQGLKFDRGATGGTLTAAADARGVVLVFPEGIDNQWCDGREEHLAPERSCDQIDDIAFISAIIDDMVREYNIDPARVYATGISNGGFMSVRLAMELSPRIAAVAPVTAQLSIPLSEQKPERPMPIMIVNGTADPLVPFDGGEVRIVEFGRSRGEILSTADTVQHFRLHNGCNVVPEVNMLPDKDPDDGTMVEIEIYNNCKPGGEVTLVKIIGGGHTWPGGKQYLGESLVGVVSREINASELIIDFFLEHARSFEALP